MALALYRKYRPATFAEVVGQEHVTEPLRTALAAGRINHAYLFSGPRGCGKTSSARIMARSLNCVEGPTPDPCGVCGPCRALAPEGPGSVDVTELDAASHGGVDDARELRDRAFYAPAESRYRVFIIDEAHMVTPQGFNALLKIVEEPPEHLIFIFATTEPDKVLTTIRSRTHHYPFRLIPPSAMRELLERNVAAEGVPVEPAVFPLVIRAGGGSARDTQSVLDQLLAGAGPEGITYDRAVALLGVTDVALIDAMVDALATEDAANVYGTVDHLAEAGHDPRRFATDLLDRFRDLILLRSVPDAANSGMVSAPEEQIERMVSQAQRIEPGTLTRYAEILHNGLLEMRGATSPRLVLELLCARMLLPEASDAEGAMLQRLERLERRLAAGGAPAASAEGGPSPQQPPSAAGAAPGDRVYERPSQRAVRGQDPGGGEPAPARQTSPPGREQPRPQAHPQQSGAQQSHPRQAEQRQAERARPAEAGPGPERPAAREAEPGRVDAAGLRQYWPQVLAAVRKQSRSTEALLTGATVHSVNGSTVVLTHPAEPLVRRLSEKRNVECIAAALNQVVSGEWHVRCVHPSAAPTEAAPGNAAPGNAAPGNAAPGTATSGNGTPANAAPGNAASANRAPGNARSSAPRAPESTARAPGAGRQQDQPRRTYQRPSGAARSDAAGSPGPTAGEPDIPLPPEPPEDEVPYPPPEADDPGGDPAGAAGREPEVDAETRAYRLLSEHLGARPID